MQLDGQAVTVNCYAGQTHDQSHPGDDNKHPEAYFREPFVSACRFAMTWRRRRG